MRHTEFRLAAYQKIPFVVSLGLSLSIGLAGLASPSLALTPQSRDAYLQAQVMERRGNLTEAE
jgi:hypothetical protein